MERGKNTILCHLLRFIKIQNKLLNNQNYNFQTPWVIIYADESNLVETTHITYCMFFAITLE